MPIAGPINLVGARNETLGFAIRLRSAGVDRQATLRLTDLIREENNADRLPADRIELGQILPMPIDLNRAGYIRQSGVTAAGVKTLPRAIVPAGKGAVALSSLRADPGADPLLWVDLAVPSSTPAGTYHGHVELVAAGAVDARLPIRLSVYDLVLPDQRSLQVLGEVTWDSLTRHFTEEFEAVTPKLLNRSDARYKRPIATLDALVTLAQQHRLTLTIDRLQPTAKWNPPSVDWRDFDSVAGPWLDGTAFADKEPLGVWPLPTIDFLFNYPAAARREYYANAAAHFDARDWLLRAPVWIKGQGGATSGTERRRMLEQAADVLAAHPRVRVALPLEAEQFQFADTPNSTLPPRAADDRLVAASPGLIFNTPIQSGTPRKSPTFLRTDLTGLIPFAGTGGDERDVRVWAWLAYTRGASIVRFDNVLPTSDRPDQQADPNELIWFYPGKWFGVKDPVPSLQLKWLRRAEQDHEYLMLADTRGQRINARLMARLLTKPVQIQPAQRADPVYALMAGTTDQAAWDAGMALLAKTILIRPPGAAVDEQAQRALNLETLAWVEPQEKPLVLGRSTLYEPDGKGGVNVRVGIDIYNASDTTPSNNGLSFDRVPRGWVVDPQPQLIPPLATYQVQRFALKGQIDPNATQPRQRSLLSVNFTNGYNGRVTPEPVVVPAAVSRRREGNLAINGSLDDWTDDDALHLGPLVRMLDRPTVQQHTLNDAPTPSWVYSAWSETNAYFAFKVGGLSQTPLQSAQNFVRYDFRRAWGEDVVQLVVQAVYADGTLGPALHIACKPNGGQWSERKLDLREGSDDAWEPLESGARYSCTVDRGDWRGEVAIPWRAIHPPNYVESPGRLPTMLRFNFVQHQHATGTSASWAGPVDYGRDDLFTGVLVLQELEPR